MKLINFNIALSLLLVFCICLSLTAERKTVDTSTDTPLEKAQRAFRKADSAWKDAKRIADESYQKYDRSDSAYGYLNTAWSISNSKDKEQFNALKGSVTTFLKSASSGLDAAGIDPLDVITDLAAHVLGQIEQEVWNYKSPSDKDNKTTIKNAMDAEYNNLFYLDLKWKEAKASEQSAWSKREEAESAVEELEPLTYTFGHKHIGTGYAGESHISILELSKRWKNVKWWVKGPSDTGKGSLVLSSDSNTDQSKASEMSYTYPTVGEYVISVYAEMESTDETVNDSYTLNVVPTGITFNKRSFRYGETLLVTITRDTFEWNSSATLYINSKFIESNRAQDGKIVLTYDVSNLFLIEEQTVGVGTVALYISSGFLDTSDAVHDDRIVATRYTYSSSSATAPDKPNDVILMRNINKGSLRFKWKKPDSDGGSPITDYEYQYKHWKIGSGWQLPSQWESAGKGMSKLISGLKGNTKYCVRMRAKNKAGKYSDTTYWSKSVWTQ